MSELTLEIDDEVIRRARSIAESMGKSVDQLVQEHLERLTKPRDPESLAEEFVRLSRESKGDSKRWKFNRDELHER